MSKKNRRKKKKNKGLYKDQSEMFFYGLHLICQSISESLAIFWAVARNKKPPRFIYEQEEETSTPIIEEEEYEDYSLDEDIFDEENSFIDEEVSEDEPDTSSSMLFVDDISLEDLENLSEESLEEEEEVSPSVRELVNNMTKLSNANAEKVELPQEIFDTGMSNLMKNSLDIKEAFSNGCGFNLAEEESIDIDQFLNDRQREEEEERDEMY